MPSALKRFGETHSPPRCPNTRNWNPVFWPPSGIFLAAEFAANPFTRPSRYGVYEAGIAELQKLLSGNAVMTQTKVCITISTVGGGFQCPAP